MSQSVPDIHIDFEVIESNGKHCGGKEWFRCQNLQQIMLGSLVKTQEQWGLNVVGLGGLSLGVSGLFLDFQIVKGPPTEAALGNKEDSIDPSSHTQGAANEAYRQRETPQEQAWLKIRRVRGQSVRVLNRRVRRSEEFLRSKQGFWR